jgi:hypothetical protein
MKVYKRRGISFENGLFILTTVFFLGLLYFGFDYINADQKDIARLKIIEARSTAPEKDNLALERLVNTPSVSVNNQNHMPSESQPAAPEQISPSVISAAEESTSDKYLVDKSVASDNNVELSPQWVAEADAGQPIISTNKTDIVKIQSISDSSSLSLDNEPLNKQSLDNSDKNVINDLKTLEGYSQLESLLYSSDILRNMVRSLYGISQGKIYGQKQPVRLPAGDFEMIGAGLANVYIMDKVNFRRYTPYVTLLSICDPKTVVNLYHQFLPLLEQAYRELDINHSNNFQQMTLAAIDNLLAAPAVTDEVMLVKRNGRVKFREDELEHMPATHKLMVRIGNKNRAVVEHWLEELKKELSRQNN